MPVLGELSAYVVNASTRYALATSSTAISIWESAFPSDETDTALGFYESGGPAPVYTQTGLSYERPTVQVICRSSAYATARDNAEHVYTILSAVENLDIAKSTAGGVTSYITVSPVQSPFDMGRDAEQRAQISCNYQVQKEVS
jgi:hypothetical protein